MSGRRLMMAGGVVYDAFDPLNAGSDTVFSNNDLTITNPAGVTVWDTGSRGLIKLTGKHYFELQWNKGAAPANAGMKGIGSQNDGGAIWGFWRAGEDGYGFFSTNADVFHNGVAFLSLGASYASGVWHGFAVDVPNLEMFIQDGTGWLGGGDPATRANPIDISGLSGLDIYVMASAQQGNDSITYNPGNSAFAYSVPSGYSGGVFS